MLNRLSTLLGSTPATRFISTAMMGEFSREGIVMLVMLDVGAGVCCICVETSVSFDIEDSMFKSLCSMFDLCCGC
jgi:hypothetical protein